MKNTLRSPLFHLFKFNLKLIKKSMLLLTLFTFLFASNTATAQLPITYDFESGLQGWTNNGNDSGWYTNPNWACNGTRSMFSKDNDTGNNIMRSAIIDLTSYSEITISYCHKSTGLDNNEGFRLQIFNGSNWATIRTYRLNTDFFNQGNSNPHSFSETITDAVYNFGSNSRFRFYGTANNDSEWNFFDDITITGVTATPPANDDCANAITIVSDVTCINTVGTTQSATQSLPGCTGDADDDVWYVFTATGTEHTIEVDPIDLTDAVIQVFDNCGGTSLACRDATGGASNESVTLTGLTIGNDYYVRVYSYFGGSGEQGEFNICITDPAPPPPANDDCANAITIASNLTCINTIGTTQSATQSIPGCTGDADDDVWYAFTATNTEHTIEVAPTTLNDAVFQVFDNCGGTSLACRDATGGASNESVTLTGLTIGSVYYIRVYSFFSGSGQQGEFNICITNPAPPPPPPANDDCANAITIASNLTCINTVGTTENATQSLPGCTGNADDDVWYVFTATESEHTIEVDPITLNDAVIQVFDNCGGTSLACRDATGGASNESLTLTGLTIGNDYYVRVYSYFGGSGEQGEFNICITNPAPPTNDDCANATMLTPSILCNPTSGTTIAATQSQIGCVGSADDDVWYSFIATATEHNVIVNAGTISDIVFQVFSGGCGGTSLDCENSTTGASTESSTLTGLNIGDLYHVRVYSHSGLSSASGTFDICITEVSIIIPPPPNDLCLNAISLTPDFNCNPTSGTTIGATESLAGCVGTANDDVWYSFVATRPEQQIIVDAGTINNIVFEVFDDSCAGTSHDCVNSTTGSATESITLTALSLGATYYIRVYSFSSNTNNSGTFTICVRETCQVSTALGTTSLACPSLDTGGLGFSGSDVEITCSVNGTTLVANYPEIKETTSYNVQSIPYNPPFQFGCLENPVSVNVDDVFSPTINLPFDFCFYGNTYDSCVIGSNGVISFDNTLAGQPSGYRTHNNLPSLENTTGRFYGPSIYGVHHDVDPSVGGEIGYQLITLNTGCQALVTAWKDVPMFWDNSILYSGMMVFYQDTNVIEIYAQEKNIDGSEFGPGGNPWNDGNASIGIQGDATTATVAPARNTLSPNWTVTNEAWRFTPSGASITSLKWYQNSISAANEIIDPNDDDKIGVYPIETTTYLAEVTYDLCNGSNIVETSSTTVTVSGKKTWNGSQSTAWENADNWTPSGVPVDTNCITIPVTANDPVMAGTTDGYGFNMKIETDALLTQLSNSSLTIEDKILIENDGDFEINDSASLIQITDVATNENTGTARVQREVAGLTNFDYVYWSTPVDPFDVNDISPSTPYYGIYEWIPTVDNGSAGKHGEWNYASGNMTLGQGYAIKDLEGTTTADIAEFEGKLNNGQITHFITRGTYNGGNYPGNGNVATAEDDNWNLMGNPYPSAISLTDFTTANPYIDGTLYFWRHTAPPSTAVGDPFYQGFSYNYSANDYLSANSLGSTPPGFNGYIAAGQGFFVQLLNSSPRPSGIVFNNTMRGTYANDGFYRSLDENANSESNTDEKHRIWLDLIDSNNTALSVLVGYADGATDEIDRLFDGHLLNDTDFQFYSIVTDTEKVNKLAINGKALPFEDTDTIPLGYKAAAQGQYTIAINTIDGLFNYSDQNIYIEDTELDIIHDLKANPYTFITDLGVFEDRFILRFTTQTLSVDDQELLANLDIRTFNNTIKATSANSSIKTFELFDISGRLIHKERNVENTNYSYPTNNLSSGTYVVTVTLSNGAKQSKKLNI